MDPIQTTTFILMVLSYLTNVIYGASLGNVKLFNETIDAEDHHGTVLQNIQRNYGDEFRNYEMADIENYLSGFMSPVKKEKTPIYTSKTFFGSDQFFGAHERSKESSHHPTWDPFRANRVIATQPSYFDVPDDLFPQYVYSKNNHESKAGDDNASEFSRGIEGLSENKDQYPFSDKENEYLRSEDDAASDHLHEIIIVPDGIKDKVDELSRPIDDSSDYENDLSHPIDYDSEDKMDELSHSVDDYAEDEVNEFSHIMDDTEDEVDELSHPIGDNAEEEMEDLSRPEDGSEEDYSQTVDDDAEDEMEGLSHPVDDSEDEDDYSETIDDDARDRENELSHPVDDTEDEMEELSLSVDDSEDEDEHSPSVNDDYEVQKTDFSHPEDAVDDLSHPEDAVDDLSHPEDAVDEFPHAIDDAKIQEDLFRPSGDSAKEVDNVSDPIDDKNEESEHSHQVSEDGKDMVDKFSQPIDNAEDREDELSHSIDDVRDEVDELPHPTDVEDEVDEPSHLIDDAENQEDDMDRMQSLSDSNLIEFVKNFHNSTVVTKDLDISNADIDEFQGSGDLADSFHNSLDSSLESKSARLINVFPRVNSTAECTTPKGEQGRCLSLTQCPLGEPLNNFNSFLQYVCLSRGVLVGICCPDNPVVEISDPTENSTGTSVIELKQPSDGCGLNTNTRIVGGKVSLPHEWTWMVALLRRNRFFCGGVIINDWYILTAAHCVMGVRVKDLKVRLGEHDFNEKNERQEDIPVAEIKRHALFVTLTFQHDIALLKLKRRIEYTKFIGSICLPNPKSGNYSNVNATVVGWGTEAFGGSASPVLRKVTVPVWDNDECDKTYRLERITNAFMCAGSPENGEDACQGDSGGPLMALGEEHRWEVIGIVSWGRRCGDPTFPGVYTRVTTYLDWIAENAS